MTVPLPDPRLVRVAIETYLELAYEGAPPAVVRGRIGPLFEVARETFFEEPCFEREESGAAARFCLRLGNSRYPFMKLTLDPRPDQGGYLFKADTHDRHICPPEGTQDHENFLDLMKFNAGLAASIERAWEEREVPTFKSWLKADLSRRQAQHRPRE